MQVVVLGAGGHTGRFVVDTLRREGAIAIPATRSGSFRSIAGIEEAARVLDFAWPDMLDAALAGADAVINCAGPFFDTALPAARAAIRAGILYLDVTAEQATVLRLFDELDDPARAAGTMIIPAMAFYGGLADLLVSGCVEDGDRPDAIEIATALDGWHPTAGTRLTGERNIFPRLIVADGRLQPAPAPSVSKHWVFPAPFDEQAVIGVPMSEMALIARHVAAGSVSSYMNTKPLADLRDPATPPPVVVDERGRSAQHFAMDVRVIVAGEERRAIATGQDIYAVTAPLVVHACLDLLRRHDTPYGVRAPGEVLSARAFLAKLAPDIRVAF